LGLNNLSKMITDAIQSVLEGISINAFSPIFDTDNMPVGLFATHVETIAEKLKDKEEIYGYVHNVAITVVADSQEQIDPATVQIAETIELLSGTVEGTIIEESQFISSEGVAWDNELKKYFDQLIFTVQTKNR